MKESKLVTLAILTYSKAQILQSILENEGIKVYIHNVNLIQPVISSGVRVRISEEDLPRALKLVEESVWLHSEDGRKDASAEKPYILIPVDFSSCALNACEFGFRLAAQLQAEVVLLHVYFSPIYMPGLSYDTESFLMSTPENASSARGIVERIHFQIQELSDKIARYIEEGKYPRVKYTCELKEGVVEEEILRYSRTRMPLVTVMGTHGENKLEHSILGNVAAEIVERSSSFVYVIPEDAGISSVTDIRRIALFTSFDSRDLIAFDTLFTTFDNQSFEVTLIHISSHQEKNQLSEDKLVSLTEYFKKKYPQLLQVRYTMVKEDSLQTDMNQLVAERKIDTICIANYRRNVLARLFNSSMAYRMLFHSKVPVLVVR